MVKITTIMTLIHTPHVLQPHEKQTSTSWIGSRGHTKRGDRDSSRSKRGGHRRTRSTESTLSASSSKISHSPVVITTVKTRKRGKESGSRAAPLAPMVPSTSGSAASVSDASPATKGRGGGGRPVSSASLSRQLQQQQARGGGAPDRSSIHPNGGGVRTLAEQRASSVADSVASATSTKESKGGSGSVTAADVPLLAAPQQTLTIEATEVSRRGSKGGIVGGGTKASREMSPSGSEYQKSEASSVVTRVYAPSSVAGDDNADPYPPRSGMSSWAMEVYLFVLFVFCFFVPVVKRFLYVDPPPTRL